MSIFNDAFSYYLVVEGRVVYRTNAVMDLYNYVQKLRRQETRKGVQDWVRKRDGQRRNFHSGQA